MFFVGQVLPGSVGRLLLGPFADQEAVDALNTSLGLDRPLVVQYLTWIRDFIQGDMGVSFVAGEEPGRAGIAVTLDGTRVESVVDVAAAAG